MSGVRIILGVIIGKASRLLKSFYTFKLKVRVCVSITVSSVTTKPTRNKVSS